MPAREVQPHARFAEWLTGTFSSTELRNVIGRWSSTASLLLDVQDAAPRAFAYEVVTQLKHRNLLDIELFAGFIEERPNCIDTLLPALEGFTEMRAISARLELVRAAKLRALDEGSISTFIDRLQRLKDTMPDLRSALVFEISELERVAQTKPMPQPVAEAAELSATPGDTPTAPISPREPRGPLLGAAALRERIEQAIVMDDLDTAKQRLLAYLEEYRGLDRARNAAAELREISPDAIVGRMLETLSEPLSTDSGQSGTESLDAIVFACRNLQKSYHIRGRRAFHLHCGELSLALGELVGVVSPNAGGKSTLLQIIAGRLTADTSDHHSYPALADGDGRRPIVWEAILSRIHFVPQRPPPWRESIVNELCLHAARCGRHGRSNTEKVGHVCDRLGLTKYLHYRWEQLSGGYQLRFELARALVSTAKLLVLDEPLAPLDIDAQVSFLEELKLIARDSKDPRAVIISTQHIWEVERMADRMLHIAGGEVMPRPATSDRCLELSSDQFSGEFLDRLRRLGTVRWTSSLQTGLLLETKLTNLRLLHAEVAQAARDHGTELKLVREISNSLLRTLRQRIDP